MLNTPKTAMVFAAGLGTRMKPLTNTIPKAMVEVCGKPLIDYRIEKLIEAGVEKIVVNTHYLAPIIEEHLAKNNDIEIIICREKKLLDTGGGLLNALPHLGTEPFYIVNCDTIWLDEEGQTPTLIRMVDRWNSTDMKIIMLLHPVEKAIGYEGNGDFNLENDGKILWPNPPRKYVYTGIQIFDPSLLENFEVKPFSLVELWKEHIGESTSNKHIFGIVNSGQWLHVDSVANLHIAENFLQNL